MTFEEREKLADEYKRTMREMKRLGLKIKDMPDDVAEATLALHQNALVVEMIKRERRKESK